MLMVITDVDEDYKQNMNHILKPLIDDTTQIIKQSAVCADMEN
jgi:hypothetical protein